MSDPATEDAEDDGDDSECPNCGGEGVVWGCFEDCCVCDDRDDLGCAPRECDCCRPPPTKDPRQGALSL